jgi:hypothetical protein
MLIDNAFNPQTHTIEEIEVYLERLVKAYEIELDTMRKRNKVGQCMYRHSIVYFYAHMIIYAILYRAHQCGAHVRNLNSKSHDAHFPCDRIHFLGLKGEARA